MFLNEGCPLRVGKETANRPQLKTYQKPAMSRVVSKPNDNMCLRKNVQICRTPWKCPPNFAMNCDWRVASADDSQEVKAQNFREARVPEEQYPCPSAIPLNPSVAADAYDGHLDDALVPSIPLIPIEEEEKEEKEAAAAYTAAPSEASMELQAPDLPRATLEPEHCETPLNDVPASLELPANVKPDIMTKPGVEADAAAAASAAYTAILKCKEQGSLIDPDLLISILTNPELIKKLTVEHGFSEDVLKEPAAMLKDMISPTLDGGSKGSCDVGEPSSSGSGNLSRPKMVVRGTNEPSRPADHGGVAPFSWTPSAPFRRSRSDEMMINDLINKLSGSTETEVKPVVQSTSLLTLKPDVLECRRLISQFGNDKQGEPVVASEPKTVYPLSTQALGTGPSPRPDIPKACLHLVPQSVHQNAPSMALSVGTGPSPRPHFPNSSLQMGPVQNACANGPSTIKTAGTNPSPRPQIQNPSLHVIPMSVTSGTSPSPRPHFPYSSLRLGPVQNARPNALSVAMTTQTCTSPRPNISSLHSVPHNVPHGAPSIMAGTGPSVRPHFRNSCLQLGPVQNACSNGPLMAVTAGTGPSPRPDIPKSSFLGVPQHSVSPNLPSVAMTSRTGTSPRPNISNLHSVPHIVPQGAPSLAITSPSTKNMDYFKSLIRNHGNEQKTPKVDQVEVGKSRNHQQGPLTSMGQQPMFEKPNCKYFSMPRGCRNGASCQFKHVAENQPNSGRLLLQDAQDSKRMKLGGEFGTKEVKSSPENSFGKKFW